MTPNYRKNLVEFTLGSDPEMACVDKKGTTISAGEHVKNRGGKFGADGHSTTFEIRPDPSPCPLEHISNIRKIFKDTVKESPHFLKWKWLAGSYQAGQSLGGHVHFGVKSNIIKPVEASSILSQYAGAIGLLLEDTEQAKKRRSGSYGGIEDHRADKDYGFEYRTLSSWLTHPGIASGILCLCKVVMDEVVNNKNFKCGHYVQNQTFIQADMEHVRNKYHLIWDDITQMRLYPKYKRYIDVLNRLIEKKVTWFPKTDMRAPWGLVDPTNIGGEEINLDGIWAGFIADYTNSNTPRVPRRNNLHSTPLQTYGTW